MSFGRKESEKDLVFFIDKQDLEVNNKERQSKPKASVSAEDKASTNDSTEAFNPRTGEINWDCPCLGGMAYGPCGDRFKQAFTCFVFSESDPKGVDCVPLFQTMQNCFQDYPEYYADQLARDPDGSSEGRPADARNEQPVAIASTVSTTTSATQPS